MMQNRLTLLSIFEMVGGSQATREHWQVFKTVKHTARAKRRLISALESERIAEPTKMKILRFAWSQIAPTSPDEWMSQAIGLLQQVVGPYERFEGLSGASTNEGSIADSQSEPNFEDVAIDQDL